MTSFMRVADRLVTALFALVLLAGSAAVIAYGLHVGAARDTAARIDVDAAARAPEWSGWSVALGGGGVLAVLLGAWFLLMHLRPRSVRAVTTGRVGSVDLARLADAAAEDLAKHPAVHTAKGSTRTVGGQPTVRIIAEIPPATTPAAVRLLARHCAADLQRAADADVTFQLLVKPVSTDQVRPRVT